MKVHLTALGCRLNEAELFSWARDFESQGMSLTAEPREADLVVLNTCAVTGEAARKSRQKIRRLGRLNPNAHLVVSGCYASLEPSAVAAELGVDLVVENTGKDRLAAAVVEGLDLETMPRAATEPAASALFGRGRRRAFIKVQDGCRYRCTYCIVTVARGEERSRSIADIVDEINALVDDGVEEAVLTGVHVGGYGSDLGTDLHALVLAILADTDLRRLRFASVEPWDLPPEFGALFENKRVMPHMHLPMQSGSDTVLKRMARRCRTREFIDLVDALRSRVPQFNVTTDIIVGFPGETEAEWAQTLAFVEEVRFGHVHVFPYSPREGTYAATLDDGVPLAVKRARARELHALAAVHRHGFMTAHSGEVLPVLWETARSDGAVFGYTPNYIKVRAAPDADSPTWKPQSGAIDDVLLGGLDPHEDCLLATAVRAR